MEYTVHQYSLLSASHMAQGLIDFQILSLGLIDWFEWQAIFKWYLFKCFYKKL